MEKQRKKHGKHMGKRSMNNHEKTYGFRDLPGTNPLFGSTEPLGGHRQRPHGSSSCQKLNEKQLLPWSD